MKRLTARMTAIGRQRRPKMANAQFMAPAIRTATEQSRSKGLLYGPNSPATYWKRDFGTGSPGISERVRNTVPFSSRLSLLAVTA